MLKAVLLDLKRRWGVHNTSVIAAGIAFYGLLTLIPVLTALVATYSLIADDPSEIEDQVTAAASALDEATSQLISDLINDILDSMRGSATIVILGSILIALFSASGTVQKLLGAINVAYGQRETRAGLVVRASSFAFTTAAILLITLLAALVSALPLVLDQLDMGANTELLIGIVRLPTAMLLFVVGLTVLYRYGVDRHPRSPWFNPGSLVAGGLFFLFTLGLSLYTNNIGRLPASYSLLGGIAVLMIFLQLTAVSVIIGAEVNAIVEFLSAREHDGAVDDGDDSETDRVS